MTAVAPSFLSPLVSHPSHGVRLRNARTGATLADTLLPAFDSKTRRVGLLGRTSLADGSAMIIAPCNAIHTFFMQFRIDVLFVARNGRIVKIRPAMGPWRVAGSLRAHAVVELPAGVLARGDNRVDDELVLV